MYPDPGPALRDVLANEDIRERRKGFHPDTDQGITTTMRRRARRNTLIILAIIGVIVVVTLWFINPIPR